MGTAPAVDPVADEMGHGIALSNSGGPEEECLGGAWWFVELDEVEAADVAEVMIGRGERALAEKGSSSNPGVGGGERPTRALEVGAQVAGVADEDRSGPTGLEVIGIDFVHAATGPLTVCGVDEQPCLTFGAMFLTSGCDCSLAMGDSNGLERRTGPFGWSH